MKTIDKYLTMLVRGVIGVAFPVPAGAGVPTAAGFGTFVVVPY